MHTANYDGVLGGSLQLRATVVEYENAPDECTIYPSGVTGMEQMTTWISAEEDSFVDLESVL
jgi:hypothetical protein